MTLQLLALAGAFWTAIASFVPNRDVSPARFVAALVSGAAAAHLGWALLHAEQVRLYPALLLDPTSGFCVLFLPAGVGLVSRAPRVWLALPRALLVARLGCLAAGCCGGAHGEATPLAEVAGLAILDRRVRRTAPRWTLPLFLIGFGAIRLAVAPWRAHSLLGGPTDVPVGLALAWVLVGVALAIQAAARAAPCPASRAMGRRTQNVAPSPSALCTSRVPPWSVTMR